MLDFRYNGLNKLSLLHGAFKRFTGFIVLNIKTQKLLLNTKNNLSHSNQGPIRCAKPKWKTVDP